jgi:hypothetical protein
MLIAATMDKQVFWHNTIAPNTRVSHYITMTYTPSKKKLIFFKISGIICFLTKLCAIEAICPVSGAHKKPFPRTSADTHIVLYPKFLNTDFRDVKIIFKKRREYRTPPNTGRHIGFNVTGGAKSKTTGIAGGL